MPMVGSAQSAIRVAKKGPAKKKKGKGKKKAKRAQPEARGKFSSRSSSKKCMFLN